MAAYNITVTMNLNNFISEAREVAQIMNEFADNLERNENKYDTKGVEYEIAESEE